MNTVTFHLSVEPRSGRTEHVSARVVVPSGREISVSYHPSVSADGQRAGLSLYPSDLPADQSPLWVEDRDGDDLFCSELFQGLTGRYPYEVEAWVAPNRDYAPFPGPEHADCPQLRAMGHPGSGCVEADDGFRCDYCGRAL